MKLSIVTTLYQSATTIDAFYERATATAREWAGAEYEILFVNDGSPDDSLDRAKALTERDAHVVVIDLSRNFGHHKAMMTGLKYARGEHVFLLDSDLEEDPEYLLPFAEQMDKSHCDVVYGVQESRKGGRLERWSGEWFYSFFALLTRIQLPRNVVTARLMTRRYVNALIQHEEREVFMAGLWEITGFDQCPFTIKKHHTSASTYTWRRKLSVLVNSVTSFSNTPLVGIFYIGLGISAFAGLYIAYVLTNWLFLGKPVAGWTSVMASIWLLGGMIISFIGVVGIYLSKIFSESKQRPYTIVKDIYGQQHDATS